jgi:hypothetical protein
MIQAMYTKLSPKEKMLFFGAVAGIFLVAMDQIVLGPILSQMKVLDAEIQAKTETIQRNVRILSFRDSIRKEHEKYIKYIYKGGQSEKEIITDHLQEIETIGSMNSVKISNIESGDVAESPAKREYDVVVEGEGGLSHILSFFHLLEESEYLFRIHSNELTPKSKDGSVMKYKLALSRTLLMGPDTEESMGDEEAGVDEMGNEQMEATTE